ncbi:axin isoform X2 [Bacillus rossius redtenbacheri]|uniref:axin isoform X2 n=1 Tax=Bacillus rossius redtenbacheri TaxID=93214 RepID=UPI002FDDCF27
MSSVGQGEGGDHSFDKNSPRPPVPGEETECASVFGGTHSPGFSSTWGSSQKFKQGGSSPALTPRRSSLACHTAPGGDTDAPLGFEPEGQCGEGNGSEGPPPCLRWACNLRSLLEDPEGVELFKRYLEQEGHVDTLNFWFACEGLKKQDPDIISHMVKVIYKRFFVKTQLGIPEDLRKEVHRRVKEGKDLLDGGVFDGVQEEVERLIDDTTYPNFLGSELYLRHVQAAQSSAQTSPSPSTSSSSGSSGSGRDASAAGPGPGPLPTLHEDAELVTAPPLLPLTRDTLIATQKRRASGLTPKPEAYVGDGMSVCRGRDSKKQHVRHSKQMKESATINRDPYMHHTIIPRTQRIQKEQVHPMNPDDFAAILIEKLDHVKKEQDAQEKFDHKLLEGVIGGTDEPYMMDQAAPRMLADAIREKFQVEEEDSVQDILDQHVSRVWSDLTPSRSPGLASPRPKSPDGRRRPNVLPISKMVHALVSPSAAIPSHFGNASAVHGVPHPYRSSHYPRHARKEKDVFSTFSSDSGNVHDFLESSDHKHHTSSSSGSGYLPKSRSMPDYQDSQKMELSGYDSRHRQSRDACRRSSSKKTLTDQTDSGVSVVSDSTPVMDAVSECKESWVRTWVMESGSSTAHSHGDREKHRLRIACATSPISARHGRKLAPGHSGSRSGSLERGVGVGAWGGPAPAQPFVADPSMPPLPQPHTPTQLEEARRRLLEEESRAKPGRQRFGASSKSAALHSPLESGQSTLRKGGRAGRSSLPGPPGLLDPPEFTTVVFSFCEEQVPYRTKIPGRPVTLRQFKEFLPKKGSYRYFFKTECDDLDMKVIQEEIVDDNEVLPLWEGKVMAQVKPIE